MPHYPYYWIESLICCLQDFFCFYPWLLSMRMNLFSLLFSVNMKIVTITDPCMKYENRRCKRQIYLIDNTHNNNIQFNP